MAGDSTTQDHMLGNKAYDLLKHLALISLPAIGTLYFALAQIWGFPHGGEVVGSITAFDAFLGVILGISSASYNNSDAKYDGVIHVANAEDGTVSAAMQLKNYENPAEVVQQKQVTFKVQPAESTPAEGP